VRAVALTVTGLTRRFGDVVALDAADLTVAAGEILSILGPSGCGKSTLLNLVAGHLRPDAGTIAVGDDVVASAERWIEPERRGIGMVFQDFALFPHLTVAQNVAFGMGTRSSWILRRREADRAQTRAVAALEQFGIDDLAHRYPNELSGGQRQRVAIARALAQRPGLLLLDEPFCNLDATTREHVRAETTQMLRSAGITCVFVTHDQEEALAVSDRVAVMQAGKVVQVDDPETLYRNPFCLEVAEFVGRANIVRGTANGIDVETELGSWTLVEPRSGDVTVLVRPELIGVRPDPNGTAVVMSREFRGHDVIYTVRLDSGAQVCAHRPSITMARVGERVAIEPQPGTVSALGASANAVAHELTLN
jgi:iron(III) transport system ATP-binding protein